MQNYNLKGVDETFWMKVKMFAVVNKTTIKQLIINGLHKEMKQKEEGVDDE